jgi:hypothetical protein
MIGCRKDAKDAKKNMSFYREKLNLLCAVQGRTNAARAGRARAAVFAAKNISFGFIHKSAGILT